ncbi:hypothetical protein [Leptospira bouyouniensis]|uniref:Lipoprotein n=1 Tax=Leptospira bouyouniensis TaxID=2484911 RepID=A0ABY2L0K2_9LEPT|nr:hypothetical protein [Leptospira bouyouniensis]TGK45561.1 hypothetical protein EHQ10_18780 [Leptospira bouyouniensis]
MKEKFLLLIFLLVIGTTSCGQKSEVIVENSKLRIFGSWYDEIILERIYGYDPNSKNAVNRRGPTYDPIKGFSVWKEDGKYYFQIRIDIASFEADSYFPDVSIVEEGDYSNIFYILPDSKKKISVFKFHHLTKDTGCAESYLGGKSDWIGKNQCSFIFKKYSPDPVWGTWQSSPGAIKSLYRPYRE